MDRSTFPCRRRRLADSAAGSVEQCTCGHIHLSMGPVTVRLEPAVFLALSATLGQAAEALQDHGLADERLRVRPVAEA